MIIRYFAAIGVAAVAGFGAFTVSLLQSDTGEAASGLFSPAQVERGKAAYEVRCLACHEEGLVGGEHAPPLSGDIFWGNWEGKPSRAYYSRVISTMPADNPGVVPPKEVLDIVAYIFAENGLPIGTTEVVSANELNTVPIAPPAP